MSAYQANFVASIIYNNRPLREVNKNGKRTCILPHGSEYKLRLKNKKSVRCQVEVFIDGTDVLFGKRLVINPGNSIDLERFVEDQDKGKKFKFVSIKEATDAGQLQDPEYFDNGRIEIKIYEEIFYTLTNYTFYSTPDYTYSQDYSKSPGWCQGSTVYLNTKQQHTDYITTNPSLSASNCLDTPINNKGVTIEGEESNQKFYVNNSFATTCFSEIIDIWLEGPTPLKEVKKENIELGQGAKFIHDTYILPALSLNATEQQKKDAIKWLPLYIDAIKKSA